MPAVMFSTGISTRTEVSPGRSRVTAGALFRSEAAATAGMGRATVPVWAAALSDRAATVTERPSLSTVVVLVEPSVRVTLTTLVPSGFSVVLVSLPLLSVAVVTTVPSFFVSTTSLEPSGFRVVAVVVPSGLVTVVVMLPSGFRSLSVVAAGSLSSSSSRSWEGRSGSGSGTGAPS